MSKLYLQSSLLLFFSILLFAATCEPCRTKARVVRWVDGDTVVLDIQLGFSVELKDQHCRLLGFNAPERGRPGFKEATEKARSLCPDNSEVLITEHGKGKYGRWLFDVECKGVDLNSLLK